MIEKIRTLMRGIERAAELGDKVDSLQERLLSVSNENARLRTENAALSTEYRELKSKMRAQTEADLVLTSLKIIHRATRGETMEQLSPLANLQAQQMRAMQNNSQTQWGGVLGGLGGFGQALGAIGL